MTTTTGRPQTSPLVAVVSRTAEAVGSVWANPSLRRIQLALVASLVGDGAYATAVTVWAYGEGGARAVGVFTAVRLTAAAVLAPVGAALADRFSRRSTLLFADGVRVVLVAVAALCLGLDSPWPVYVLAVAAGVLNAPFRSAQRAWMPSLARSPEELAASNAASSTLESLAAFTGPAIAGLLLALAGVSTVFWLNVATFLVSMVLVLSIRGARSRPVAAPDEPEGALAELAAGFKLLGGDGDLRVVTGQICAQTFVGGAVRVLLVVIAVEVIGTGASGVGLLDAIVGVGAVIGGVVALARADRQRLGRDMNAGVILWSLPLALLVLWVHPAPVVVALVVIGVANPLVDVNLDTIVQRMTAEHLMARVFGALDTCYIATSAVGSMVVPLLLAFLDLRWTLLVVSVPVLLVALLSLPRMTALDARLVPPPGIDLLRNVRWFRLLTPAVLESVARGLTERRVVTGQRVITEGEVGDAFYLIEAGSFTVTQEGRFLREQGPGDFFGEIALLHDIPRTATVTATADGVVQVLDREVFLRALSGDGLTMAQDVASTRLGYTGE